MMIECPHCHMETEHKVIDHINIDRNPELRAKVQRPVCFSCKMSKLRRNRARRTPVSVP